MKISHSWLQQYLDIPTDPVTTGELLTDIGLEVEGLEKTTSIPGGLAGLVIGEIKSKETHPNADRLNLTKVDVGNGDLLSIVCGAPNVAAGQKVVVATVGTTIHPIEGDPFKIKRSKIRGELSEGMICAEDEVGLGTDHDGIMVLDEAAKVGSAAADYFEVKEDAILEIGLTPNRADAFSHIGVARDLRAAFRYRHPEFKTGALAWPSVDDFKVENHDLPIKVTVENQEACPRYAGVTISGVKVAESPAWLKERLSSIGLKPINNLVDVTNFVLHEVGQPLHAFDAAEIKGNHVRVRNLPAETTFVTLDEVERKLSDHDLMICNEEDGMCIAGVFGGIRSGVSDSTTDIFLESAYFNPVSVRKTARRHALNTDASFRFERGVDPNITIYALKRAALLIKEVAGGSISSEIIDIYPEPVQPFQVSMRYDRADRLIGEKINRKVMVDILRDLEVEVIREEGEELILSVPPFKNDVLREADVIEEIFRIYGFNAVGQDGKISFSISNRQQPDLNQWQQEVSDLLTHNGFSEIMTNSLTAMERYRENPDYTEKDTVAILNPLSQELNGLRQTLVYNGLEALSYNLNRRNEDLKFYEFGRVYANKPEGEGFREASRLAIYVTGRKLEESWNTQDHAADYYYLKGWVEAVLTRMGITAPGVKEEGFSNGMIGSGQKLSITNKQVAVLGRLDAKLLKQHDLRQEVFYAEIDWDAVTKLLKLNRIKYKPVPKFPAVRRDLALLVDTAVTFDSIKQLAYKSERKLLQSVKLFDVYEGDNLGKGKKSYAVSFTFQDSEKTLTDKQVDKVMKKMQQGLEKELGASLR